MTDTRSPNERALDRMRAERNAVQDRLNDCLYSIDRMESAVRDILAIARSSFGKEWRQTEMLCEKALAEVGRG